MNYNDYQQLLVKNDLLGDIWGYVLDLVGQQLEDITDKADKDDYLTILSVYCSLIERGNVGIPLEKEKLKEKWNNRLSAQALILEDKERLNEEEISLIRNSAFVAMDRSLDDMNETVLGSIIGDNKMFVVDDGWLYMRKYQSARIGIKQSLSRLFNEGSSKASGFDYKACVSESFRLSKGQEKAVIDGFKRNLIITGGPGTGKTTSVLFLLMGLLSDTSKKYDIHLIAPSGKASSRMKESIINGLGCLLPKYKEKNKAIVSQIETLEESTIHRILAIDYATNAFTYNRNNQFGANSVFVIDEASMIDICLFNSLLQAIPDEARVFIMGDKNQLPSVECGAVFAELLKMERLRKNGNIVELDESKRFTEDTDIYKLASEINNGETLSVTSADWKDYSEFEIMPDDKKKPIFYYNCTSEGKTDKEIIESVVGKWASYFYKDLQQSANNLDVENKDDVNSLWKKTEVARILCANNETIRGTKKINSFIKRNFIDYSLRTSVENQYAGQLMMIKKNNKMLDLYNGDSGILVTLEGSSTIYFMLQKTSSIVAEDVIKVDNIFKMGGFVFYPLRLISEQEIDLAYAITIHKSQGSDYANILVLLPNSKGHPLLNRQIVYTAITRTKGNTYILSNQERLEEARDTVEVRDTNIA